MKDKEESGAVRLGRLLKKIREDNGLDLRKFAALCVKDDGAVVGFSTIAKVEKGGAPSSEIMRAIAKNPYVSKEYTLPALYEVLGGIDENPLDGKEIYSAHTIIPYAVDLPESQKRELILKLIPTLSAEVKQDIVLSILQSYSQPSKGRKK